MAYAIGLPEILWGKWLKQPITSTKFPGVYFNFTKRRQFSDVIQLPMTNQLLFVDDSKKRRLYVMPVNGLEQEDPEPRAILLPNEIRLEDAEALTTDGGSHIYICTSHALKKNRVKREEARRKPQAHGFLRFRFDSSGAAVPDGVIKNLREILARRYWFINEIDGLPPQKGGLNIEGLAFDQANNRLLVGLRAPLLDGKPCLLPAHVKPGAPLSEENLFWENPIQLQIPNKGIRSIQFDDKLGKFLVLVGNVRKGRGGDFALWLWDGNSAGRARLVESVRFLHYFNPEGVTPVRLPDGEEFIYIVSDNGGGYMKLRYQDLKLH